MLVHADPRVYPTQSVDGDDPYFGGYTALVNAATVAAATSEQRNDGRPGKSCDNPMVGKGVISEELLQIQLVAFLLAQGNQTYVHEWNCGRWLCNKHSDSNFDEYALDSRYFALSEGWTDMQQPPVDNKRPMEQWRWQSVYDVKYGAPIGPTVVTNV
eukprot:SAG31_NODE_487_length_14980_cov_9.526376_8_plen_157_part_00